jgi:hypothetical protein
MRGTEPTEKGYLFDIVEDEDALAHDEVPICPPPDNEDRGESNGYTPTSAASTPESGFFDEELGEFLPVPGGVAKKAGKAKGLFIEFCCKETSPVCKIDESLGISYLGVTKECLNAEDGDAFQQLLLWVQDEIQQEKCPVHLWGSLPYTIECRAASLDLVTKFHSLAELVQCSRGGSVSFEWSHHSEGWNEPKVQNCMSSLGLQAVHMDACAFGFITDEKHFQRKWTIQTDNPRLIRELQTKTCRHAKGFHGQLEGKITVKPGLRNTTMAICIITTLFPGVIMDMVPMMPVLPFKIDPHRARLHDFHTPDICVIGAIHKLLTREEMRADPKAIQAIKEEGKGVREKFVWDDDSVMEKSDRLALARRENKVIHVAEVMPIASIKHWE